MASEDTSIPIAFGFPGYEVYPRKVNMNGLCPPVRLLSLQYIIRVLSAMYLQFPFAEPLGERLPDKFCLSLRELQWIIASSAKLSNGILA